MKIRSTIFLKKHRKPLRVAANQKGEIMDIQKENVEEENIKKNQNFEDAVLHELEEYQKRLSTHLEGKEVNDKAWKSYRLRHGVYGQKQGDRQMLRIRIPYGRLNRAQIYQIAHIIEQYSDRPSKDVDAGMLGHITTRQAIQIHFTKLEETPAVQKLLADVGLTGRDACGDAIRNIVAPALAGVDPEHPFDVTPYAEWINHHCLRNSELAGVPRKFKIAFAGSPSERGQTLINDIGYEAMLNKKGERGFRVTLGGGLGIPPTLGKLLYEFAPEDQVLAITRAILEIFITHTEAKYRRKMRFKYIIRRFGWDKTVELIKEALPKYLNRPELRKLPKRGPLFDQSKLDVAKTWLELQEKHTEPAFAQWLKSSVHPQTQEDFFAVRIHTDRGDLTPTQWRSLADSACEFGIGEVRTDRDQNAVVPFIKKKDLWSFYNHLERMNLLRIPAGGSIDPVSCPGGDTCNLAVTKSRALTRKIEECISAWEPYADVHTSIRVSGCPNSCGQHLTATIGFWGSAKKVQGRLMPCYELMIGGGDDGTNSVQLAKPIGRIPSRAVPEVLDILLEYYIANKQNGETLSPFFARVDKKDVKEILNPFFEYEKLATDHSEYFQEWYSTNIFSIHKGESECA